METKTHYQHRLGNTILWPPIALWPKLPQRVVIRIDSGFIKLHRNKNIQTLPSDSQQTTSLQIWKQAGFFHQSAMKLFYLSSILQARNFASRIFLATFAAVLGLQVLVPHIYIYIIYTCVCVCVCVRACVRVCVCWLASSGSATTHLPVWPWTFALNIGFNMITSDSIVACLDSMLWYSTGGFQALQLILSLWCLVPWVTNLKKVCL